MFVMYLDLHFRDKLRMNRAIMEHKQSIDPNWKGVSNLVSLNANTQNMETKTRDNVNENNDNDNNNNTVDDIEDMYGDNENIKNKFNNDKYNTQNQPQFETPDKTNTGIQNIPPRIVTFIDKEGAVAATGDYID